MRTIYPNAGRPPTGSAGVLFGNRALVDPPAVLDIPHRLLEGGGVAVEYIALGVSAERQDPAVEVNVLTVPDPQHGVALIGGFCRAVRNPSPGASYSHLRG